MSVANNRFAEYIDEQKAIEDLAYEVEKVLHYYQEHPQYPLDFDKIRSRMQEVNARLTKLREQMQGLEV